ncbi:MAG: FxDxF family PEP-CTERM protein [Gammaproteobacteria bacterium]|nr:FxDxF family PEP-CTERM protein [Gammaproteobacteria bacterium]
MMNKLKMAALGTTLFLSSGMSHAGVYDIGILGTTAYGSGVRTVTGNFEDRYVFDLPVLSAVGSGGNNVPLRLNLGSISISYDISNLDLSIFDSSNSLVSDTNADPLLFNGLLNAGNDYYLKVTGLATGNQGGMYTLALVAAPVPEAETWVMMLTGLGLLGWHLSRRQQASNKPEGLVGA